jgi:phospholipid/cholesterol/gamma-HCH transport system ATP-binding protein
MLMTNEAEYILEFCDVASEPGAGLVMGISGASIRVGRGEIALVSVEAHGASVPLFDLAEGLLPPDKGIVKFLGKQWQDLGISQQAGMRGLIGRTFETHGWISNLSVYDNISLSQRHHTHRAEAGIRQQAEHLARAAGLEDIPEQRPELVGRRELQKCQWVRAFLGNPALVLLEHPETGVKAEDLARLLAMTEEAVGHGVAVMWLTTDERVRENELLRRAAKYAVLEGKIISEAL